MWFNTGASMTDSDAAGSPTPDTSKDDRDRRKGLLERIEGAFDGAGVITYITSTRANLEVMMAIDIIPRLYAHLVDYAKPFIIKINDLGRRRSEQWSKIIPGSFA